MKAGSQKTILFLSLPLILLVTIVSYIGFYAPDFYAPETANWRAQAVGQDMVDLFMVVPVLAATAVLAFRGNRLATDLWAGTVLYLLYTFVIYCFDVHFNRLFIHYCLSFGLSFYSFMYFLYCRLKQPVVLFRAPIVKVVGIYLVVLPCIFYYLWFSVLLPSIFSNSAPAELAATGLFTNPVHVIDVSVFLPGLFVAGISLLRSHRLGFIMAPVFLFFFVLMDITIGTLALLMRHDGVGTDTTISVVMGILALISVVLLFLYSKQYRVVTDETLNE